MSDEASSIDRWLSELGVDVVGASGDGRGGALSRDIVVDGQRRHDLRITVAWVAGVGTSLWAYYGLEAMEVPKRIYARMLRANFEYPFVKFAMTDDDRPMLVTELPARGVDRDDLGRALARLVIVADRLLDDTAHAISDRGVLPDWSGRTGRNPQLLAAHRAEVEAVMPPLAPAAPRPRRRGLLTRLFGFMRPRELLE
jgi:hypothetical protein